MAGPGCRHPEIGDPAGYPRGVELASSLERGIGIVEDGPLALDDALGRLAAIGVQFVPHEPPSTLIIGLFGDAGQPWHHIKILARLAKIAHDPSALEQIRAATDASDLVMRLLARDAVHA